MSVFKVSFMGTRIGEHNGKPSKIRFKVQDEEGEDYYSSGGEQKIEFDIDLEYKDVTNLKITEVYE
jgi:hypothetical protein